MSKLPDSDDHAENAGAVKDGFQSGAAFLFRPHQESIGGFLMVVHKRLFG